MSRLIFVISYILATLLCTCRASPAGERRIVQNAAPEQESRVCAAASSAITSARDFQAKIRADPRVCSIHDGFFHLVSRDTNDDYSCSETKPCSNGACCAKTGFCNYGKHSPIQKPYSKKELTSNRTRGLRYKWSISQRQMLVKL